MRVCTCQVTLKEQCWCATTVGHRIFEDHSFSPLWLWSVILNSIVTKEEQRIDGTPLSYQGEICDLMAM